MRNGNRGTADKKVGKSAPALVTKKAFTVLKEQCTRDAKEKTEETTLSSGKIVVVDSQVRGLGRVFCARDSERRTCVCLPGAGVGEVSDRLEDVLAREDDSHTVCISEGWNDLGRVRTEELFRRFRKAL